ncbi:SDR family NAD(P)-dependent oxidoreductase [Alcanivorax sediminis]|uniref:SDR family NAD(P)-dependent oxidoreductase n=1 Tax=Alcanivorax sediminis TaxID=2663008 RepID=A0A6N7LS25_9GAMM|nr:SDR family NAD(P)-dependent oxidoreductase [Alcanivorax sediminis]MQX51795.1 SDR family NAD(P)-dependent oxidoreductase [Alcanivorax sediminis]
MFGNGKKLSTRASAVVTGAGSGIGRAFAEELARRGGAVLCSDINLVSAQETADRIEAAGGRAWAVKCDVSVRSDMEALAEQADALLPEPVNLVINNAGVGVGGKNIGEISLEDWEWTMGINLWGVIHGCHVFAPRLKAQGRGGIINVASTASFAAAPLMGPYNVTKAGVLALSETLAAETAGTGVNVTVLCPTVVNTNIFTSGRIHGGVPPVLSRLIELTGVSAESVAATTLKALDRGQLHVLPQFDARMIWRAKRLLPATYTRGAGLLSRLAAAKR